LTDSYFVVAHFHYTLIGGMLFGIFAAIYYWYPKATGRAMSETLGRWHFWPSLVFMNAIFMPMFLTGLAGMSRRLADGGATYAFTKPVLHYNRMSSYSAWALALAQIPFIINFFWSRKHGAKTEPNAWHATTLEWSAAPSPPPHGNFDRIPVVVRGPYEYSGPECPDGEDYIPQAPNLVVPEGVPAKVH
jgi:cytochrome c oxidase subunit 1